MADASLNFDTKIDTGSFQKGLQSLTKTAETGLQGVGVMIGTLAATAVSGVIAGARAYVDGAIDVASDLNEVQNVVNTTFEAGAESVNTFAKSAKEAYGLSELKAKQFTSTMGAMLKSMGMTSDETLDMSESMTGLAADMASFYNLSQQDAFDKLRSGISGETEPLKQLGINMSVANLEAYALTQGITKTYDKMTQAEQTTLRYGYLMQVTADAQGDFARTSDGYANQQRILATTQEELAASIGEFFLPIALEATKALDGMVGSLGDAVEWVDNLLNPPKSELELEMENVEKAAADLDKAISNADKNLNTSLESAKATQATAISLLGNYEKIQSKQVLTDADTAQLRTIAKEIVNLYPDMGSAIDTTTGLFNTNTTAIRNNITELGNQQLAMAYYNSRQEYADALASASILEDKARKAHDVAYKDYIAKNQYAESAQMMKKAIEASGRNVSVIESYAGQLLSLSPYFNDYFTLMADGTYKLTTTEAPGWRASNLFEDLATNVAYYNGVAYNAKINSEDLDRTVTTLAADTAKATEAWNESGESFEEFGGTMILTTDSANAFNGVFGSIPGGLSRIGKGINSDSAAIEQLRATLKKLSDDTIKQIDQQVNGFERINKVRPKSTKATVKNLNGQTKFLDDYATNFAKAKEKGVSPEALAELATVTDENAATLAGLAKASSTEITNFNTAIANRNAERIALSTELAGFLTDLTAANTALDTSIANAGPVVTEVSKAVVAGVTTANATAATQATSAKTSATDAKTAEDAAKTSATGATAAVQGMVDGIGQIVEGSVRDLKASGSQVVAYVAEGVSGNDSIKTTLVTKVSSAASGVKSYVGADGQTVYKSFYNLGAYVAQGVAAGIRSGTWISDAMVQAIRDALAAARLAGNVSSSTSRLFARESGSPLAEGVGYGFTKEMKNVNAVMEQSLLASVPSLSIDRQRSQWQMLSAMEATTPQAAGSVDNSTHVTFEYPIQAPDEVARAIRRANTNGLAAARRK